MAVLVTGASGFIGSAVVRELVRQEVAVVALVEPGVDAANLSGISPQLVDQVVADIRDRAALVRAAKGCDSIIHVAAVYRFWARDPAIFYEVNVGGTRNVLAAGAEVGVRRMVYTSTVGTLGIERAGPDNPATEESWPRVEHLFGYYKRSKYVAEHEVLRAAAAGLDVSVVQPTFPLGPGDRAPTPTGKLVLDFLNGMVPGYVDTTLNVVHVDDVAKGHVLALERGQRGRNYILGGENWSLRQLLDEMATICGLTPVRIRVPRRLSLGVAHASELVEGRLLRRHPSVPLEAARMSTTQMAFCDQRARQELGYAPRPAAEAVRESARWFCDNGYVKPSRLRRMSWKG